MQLTGAENAVAADVRGWPQLSIEPLLASSPDLIIHPRSIDAATLKALFTGDVRWRNVGAVKNGDIFAVDDDLFSVGTSPGRGGAGTEPHTRPLGAANVKRGLIIGTLVLLPLLVLIMLMAVIMGATPVAIADAVSNYGSARMILLQVRLPRVVVAAPAGAIRGVRSHLPDDPSDPLADPFILGVSGGAACAAAMATGVGWPMSRGRAGGGLRRRVLASGGAPGAEARSPDPLRLLLGGSC